MSKDIAKLYAAFRSGCIGNNIIDAYFPFLAKIIVDDNLKEIDPEILSQKFQEKYDFNISIHIIRQIIGIGIHNGSIEDKFGKYIVNSSKIKEFISINGEFDSNWKILLNLFIKYCEEKELDISEYDIEKCILDSIDMHDEKIVTNDSSFVEFETDRFSFAWFSFLKELSHSNEPLFDFVAGLSFGNIMKQALFFSVEGRDTYKGLNVYLDTPMIFSLMNIDTPSRVESTKLLIKEMIDAGCDVRVFDNNLEEAKGILISAGGWANSTAYNMEKANNAAIYFHDNLMSEQDVHEFCESLESQLNEYGVTICSTSYDAHETKFHESEEILCKMIEEKYREHGNEIKEEKIQSIRIDVRSIIMIYYERKGDVSTKIQTSKHIMLTFNNAIANVCKNYESNQSINSGHIPACISADLFGSILWLFTPLKLIEYQRKQLLADCYISLKPSKAMLEKYLESLERAKNAEEIDEKKFLFLRSSGLVSESLMNVIKGDYARFTDRTYIEVYNDIVEKADKKYKDEAIEHERTRIIVEELRKKQVETETFYNNKITSISNELSDLKESIKNEKETIFAKKCTWLGWAITIFLFGIPYIIAISMIDILKSKYSDFSYFSITIVVILVIISLIVFFLFKKGKSWSFKRAEKLLTPKKIPPLTLK